MASSVAKLATEKAQRLGTAELLFQAAETMGLCPSWIIENGLFAVSFRGREQYINFARSPLNSHSGASLAKNKHLTRQILKRHNLPNIPFTRPRSQADAALFLLEYGKIIAKPVNGSGAQDIHIVTLASELQALTIQKYILEQYIEGEELRYLVLNGTVVGVYRSDYGISVQVDRQMQTIAYDSNMWSQPLVSSALQVADILGLKFAAVDYLITASGHAYILEVNTTPDLKWFHAPTFGPVVDVAAQFLEAVFKDQDEEEHESSNRLHQK